MPNEMSAAMSSFPDIIPAPSKNFDERAFPISMLVLHYTGMENGKLALERLTENQSKVSAHYLVEEDGRVFQLVDEKMRAWHAGLSYWSGLTDINSASIGIEIVNGGHDFGLPEFPKQQIETVIHLCQSIKKRHNISDFNIVAHSDIAPSRKQDPGEKFPWKILADNNIGHYPADEFYENNRHKSVLYKSGDKNKDIKTIQSSLKYLGYGLPVSGVLDTPTTEVVAAFQRRYRPDKIDGLIDTQTLKILLLLCKYKSKVEGTAGVG